MIKRISNPEEFAEVQRVLQVALTSVPMLPNQLFNKQFVSVKAEQFEWYGCDEVWSSFQMLSANCGAKQIYFGSLDPDPVDCYLKLFGHYNWWSLPVGMTDSDYTVAFLAAPGESELVAFPKVIAPSEVYAHRYSAEVLVAVADNGAFVVYGDRSFECALLAVRDKQYLENLDPPWWDCREFMNSGLLKTAPDREAFLRAFEANFCIDRS